MSSPFIRVDAEGRILGGSDGKFSADVTTYLSNLRNGTIASSVNGAVAAPSVIADEPNFGGVPVDGSVSGVIDFNGDVDYYTVNLTAGETYLFSLTGTGATPINDSLIVLYGPDGSFINFDDDGGNDLYSILTYTAATDGIYYLRAQTFVNPNPDVGGYTIDVRQQGADVGDTNATAGTLSLGTNFGFIEASDDVDRYAVELEAGQYYTFSLAGGADYNTDYLNVPTGELDTIVALYDAAGNLLTFNDDNSFPGDISSGLGFFAETGGTYYIDALAYSGQTGGYALAFEQVDLSSLDPLDSIDWRNADDVPFVDVGGVQTAYVYFGAAGENFGEMGDDGVTPMVTYGWQQHEINAVMLALEQYEQILGTNYVITTDINQATFRLSTTSSDNYGAYFYPQDPAFGDAQGIGVFNIDSGGWTLPASLQQGGYAFAVILHEFGHAHGLAHPHDTGGGSDVMVGVTGSGTRGIFDLNQGVYTVMSYNDAWDTGPNGPSPFTLAGIGSGWSGTLSPFDIAMLQERYEVAPASNTGNTVYALADNNVQGAYYQTIYDTAGTDTLSYTGLRDVQIDLLAATLDYTATGGGVVSFVDGVFGGYTIANGVVIENATSGSGNDVLLGNGANNVLTANNGDDFLFGREGNDTLIGGNGLDNLNGGEGDDNLQGGNGVDVLNGGEGNDLLNGGRGKDLFVFADAGIDTIVGYEKGEKIDLSALDVTMGNVTIFANRIVVDLAGADDLTIMFNTNNFSTQNLIFDAPAAADFMVPSSSIQADYYLV